MAGGFDLKALQAEAKEHPRPIYLLLGDAVTTSAAAHGLIEVLVPPTSRDFNVEIYDGRTTPIATVLDSLRMHGLIPGTKAVWVRETTLLLSAEKKADLTAALLDALEQERQDEAAARLLTLLAMAGWTQERLQSEPLDQLSSAKRKECFGIELSAEQLQALVALQAYCHKRDLSIGSYRDDSELLIELFDQGLPAGNVLILSTAAADARKRVFKRLEKAGALVDLRLARERSGALSRDGVVESCRRFAREFGLQVEPRALELIVARAGSDAGALAMEMEKLCLYVCESKVITEEDVRVGFRDMAESWIFDFTGALAARQAGTAVCLLRDLLAQGDHPLRLLAMIARELRLLLAARDCLDGPLAEKWRGAVSYAAFQSRLQPLLGELGAEAFGNMHPFRVFKYLSDTASIPKSQLEWGLIESAELDRKFKSSRGSPEILLETLIRDLCQAPPENTRRNPPSTAGR